MALSIMDDRGAEKMICNWRITRGVPSGLHVWFDPNVESVKLYRVATRDQQLVLVPEGALDAGVGPGYLDKVGSVSESGPDRTSGDSSREEDGHQLELTDDLPF